MDLYLLVGHCKCSSKHAFVLFYSLVAVLCVLLVSACSGILFLSSCILFAWRQVFVCLCLRAQGDMQLQSRIQLFIKLKFLFVFYLCVLRWPKKANKYCYLLTMTIECYLLLLSHTNYLRSFEKQTRSKQKQLSKCAQANNTTTATTTTTTATHDNTQIDEF